MKLIRLLIAAMTITLAAVSCTVQADSSPTVQPMTWPPVFDPCLHC